MADTVHEAMGMVETRGLVAALEAADAMLKASHVTLIGVEKTMAALMTVHISGETAAVQAAVDAGKSAASKVGEVVSSHVIARPSSDVRDMLRGGPPAKSSSPTRSLLELEKMTVRQLRAYARRVRNISIRGREIARANKQQLLDALRINS